MEDTNVNNLNGIPNFGHGMPDDGVVIAGVTDVPQLQVNLDEDHGIQEEVQEDVPADEITAQEING